MNWLTKIKVFGDKIKRNLQKKFPTKEEIANSVERKIQVKDSIVSKGWLQNAKLKKNTEGQVRFGCNLGQSIAYICRL